MNLTEENNEYTFVNAVIQCSVWNMEFRFFIQSPGLLGPCIQVSQLQWLGFPEAPRLVLVGWECLAVTKSNIWPFMSVQNFNIS